MQHQQGIWVSLIFFAIISMSCSLAERTVEEFQEEGITSPTPTRSEAVAWSGGEYQSADFAFRVPERWSLHEGPSAQGQNAWNYYRLNLKILVEVNSPQRLPKVTITQGDIPQGSSLEQVFLDTYNEISTEIREASEPQSTQVDGLPAWTMRYERPWGEPWYAFQDTWVENSGKIYTVSCLWNLNPTEEEEQGCRTILDSFHFTTTAHPATPEPEAVETVPPEPSAEPENADATEALPPGGCPENLGKLVFGYDPMDLSGVHYGIYLMEADGSGRIRLSSEEERNDNMPSWSPERCRIAFRSHSPDGDDDIFVMNADGTLLGRLTTDPADDLFPEWSPDGKQIAFISYRDGYRNLFVMEADGSQQRQLTFNQKEFTQWLAWSPDGEYIAYTYNPEGGEIGGSIHVIRPDGSGERQVTPQEGSRHDSEPTWSPDGEKLYFLSNRSAHVEIWEINLDGTGLKQISTLYGSGYGIDHSLRISPDGNFLVFYGAGDGAEFMTDLYRIGVDGSGLTNLTRSPGREEWVDW